MNISIDESEIMITQTKSLELSNLEIKNNSNSKRNQFKFERPSLNCKFFSFFKYKKFYYIYIYCFDIVNFITTLKRLKTFDSFTSSP